MLRRLHGELTLRGGRTPDVPPDEVARSPRGGTALSVSYVGDDEDPDVLASSVEAARFTDGTVRPTWDIVLYAH